MKSTTRSLPAKLPLPGYLGLSAAALIPGGSEAAIVYSGTQNITIGQFSSQNLNLDGDAYNDILLKNYVFGGGNYQGAYVPGFGGRLMAFHSGFNYVSLLSSGDTISSATISSDIWGASMAYGAANPNAQFNTVTGSLLGLSFPILGVNHYGWVRVTIDNAAGTFVINDWAYNDVPGEAISAGAVPEPSSLALLATGGIAALRRRRKEAA